MDESLLKFLRTNHLSYWLGIVDFWIPCHPVVPSLLHELCPFPCQQLISSLFISHSHPRGCSLGHTAASSRRWGAPPWNVCRIHVSNSDSRFIRIVGNRVLSWDGKVSSPLTSPISPECAERIVSSTTRRLHDSRKDDFVRDGRLPGEPYSQAWGASDYRVLIECWGNEWDSTLRHVLQIKFAQQYFFSDAVYNRTVSNFPSTILQLPLLDHYLIQLSLNHPSVTLISPPFDGIQVSLQFRKPFSYLITLLSFYVTHVTK